MSLESGEEDTIMTDKNTSYSLYEVLRTPITENHLDSAHLSSRCNEKEKDKQTERHVAPAA